jgi:hypothetical protein
MQLADRYCMARDGWGQKLEIGILHIKDGQH